MKRILRLTNHIQRFTNHILRVVKRILRFTNPILRLTNPNLRLMDHILRPMNHILRVMKPSLLCFSALALALLFASCDDGSIQEKSGAMAVGKVVKMEGRVLGLNSYPSHYNVSIAGFTEDADAEPSPYATISKVLTADTLGNVSIVMSGISGAVTDVELCLLNSLRQRIVTFVASDISAQRGDDTIRINIGTVDVGMFSAIQTGLFNLSCIGCHGSNGFSGAGLNLTAGNSYADLVGKTSTKLPQQERVLAGDAAHSVLYEVINDSAFSRDWRENHADVLNQERSAGLITLVRDWIDSGAEQ